MENSASVRKYELRTVVVDMSRFVDLNMQILPSNKIRMTKIWSAKCEETTPFGLSLWMILCLRARVNGVHAFSLACFSWATAHLQVSCCSAAATAVSNATSVLEWIDEKKRSLIIQSCKAKCSAFTCKNRRLFSSHYTCNKVLSKCYEIQFTPFAW